MKQLKVVLHGVPNVYRFDDTEVWTLESGATLLRTLLVDPYATKPYLIEYRGASSWLIYRGGIEVGYAIATPQLKG